MLITQKPFLAATCLIALVNLLNFKFVKRFSFSTQTQVFQGDQPDLLHFYIMNKKTLNESLFNGDAEMRTSTFLFLSLFVFKTKHSILREGKNEEML